MKILITTLMLISSSMALACPNLSGKYRDDYGNTTQIVQSGCKSMKIISSDAPTVVVIADGIMREVLNDTMNEDGVEVKVQLSMQATFTATELLVNNIARSEEDGQVLNTKMSSVVTLLSNGDMKTVMTNADGSITTSIDKKIN